MKRYWTEQRVFDALKFAMMEIKGPLPCTDKDYNCLKKGRGDWPPAMRILEYHHSIGRAWLEAGAPNHRVSLRNIRWTRKEDDYLIGCAGIMKLTTIAKNLCRSYASVKSRLNKHHKIHARECEGYFSAANLSKEYRCPYHRVRDALVAGKIKGKYDKVRNRWKVDLADITPEAEAILRAPKVRRHNTLDLGDYYQRYSLRRTVINGRIKVIEAVAKGGG